MTLRTRLYILTLLAAALTAVSPATAVGQQPASTPQWEQTDAQTPNIASEIGRSEGATVRVHDMHIYVELEQPTQVKLFTILGQPVASHTLPAGTSRLRVAARGIYILKIGSSTRRITI